MTKQPLRHEKSYGKRFLIYFVLFLLILVIFILGWWMGKAGTIETENKTTSQNKDKTAEEFEDSNDKKFKLELFNQQKLNDFRKNNGVIILPIGSVESHGNHLPLSSDTLIAENIALSVAQNNDYVAIAPAVRYSTHQLFIGDSEGLSEVNITQKNFENFIEDVVTSLFRDSKISNIVLLYGHDMELYDIEHLKSVIGVNGKLKLENVYVDLRNKPNISIAAMGHGDGVETSLLLYQRPDLVDDERAKELFKAEKNDEHLETQKMHYYVEGLSSEHWDKVDRDFGKKLHETTVNYINNLVRKMRQGEL